MLRNLNKFLLETASNRRFKHKTARNRNNPGVNLRLSALSEGQPSERDFDAFEPDDFESDFTNVGLTHKEHLKQMSAMKEKEQFLIVQRKYFKTKLPNFLTWSDKQQIRYLHAKDPENWNVEKLSEGFPALPEVILKILKSSWSKKNEIKIKNHDASVRKNWELFKEGKLELPKDVIEHLNKFSDRNLSPESFQSDIETPKEVRLVEKIEGEFSEIIKSYERLKKKRSAGEVENQKIDDVKPKAETYTLTPPKEYEIKNRMTFSEFKNKLKEKSEKGEELTVEDKLILHQNTVVEEKIEQENPIVDISQFKNNTNRLPTVFKPKDYKHLEYPEKITIPKDKYKKGFTYKLNDCYYDSDGLFLYRVPGMYN